MKGHLIIIEKIIKILLSFYIALLIANTLGVVDYGKYMLVMSIFNILQVFTGFGFDQYFPKYLNLKNKYSFKSLLIIKVTIAIISFAVLLYLVFVYDFYVSALYYLLFIGFSIWEFLETSFYKIKKLKQLSYFRYLVQIVTILLKLYGIAYHPTVEFFLSVYILEYACLSIFYIIVVLQNYSVLQLNVENSGKSRSVEIKEILRSILPLGLNSILTIGFMKMDHFFNGYYFGGKDLGEYSLMLSLFSAPLFLTQILNYLVFNWLSDELKVNRENISKFYQFFFLVGLLSYIGVIIIGYMLKAFNIVNPSYTDYNNYLLLYGISLPFIFIGVIDYTINNLTDTSDIILKKTAISFCAALILYYPLIHYFGVYGLCITNVLVQLLNTTVLNWFFNNYNFKMQMKAIGNLFYSKELVLMFYKKLK